MSSQAPERSTNWRLRLVIAAAVLVVLVYFVAANYVTVEVRLLFMEFETRLAWALIAAGALGFIAGLLVPFRRR